MTIKLNKNKLLQLVILLYLVPGHTNIASAFGLKTHLWLAEQILAELGSDCSVSILEKEYILENRICIAINMYPNEFLSGALGPDIYPDMIVGQTTTHPGIVGGWQTDQWLAHLISNATSPKEIAFSYGLLVHASGDIFAHTYVNAYSGDVFELFDERAVEIRHFVLEKYIDDKVPTRKFNSNNLSIPSSFLRDIYIFNNAAESQYVKSGTGMHLVSMNSVKKSVYKLNEILDGVEGFVGELIAEYISKSLELNTKIATGEFQLEVAIEALKVQEKLLKEKQNILNQKEKVLNSAISTIQKNEDLINELITLANLQKNIATEASNQIQSYNNSVGNLRRELSDFQQNIRNIPSKVTTEVCRTETVDTVCNVLSLGGLNPFTRRVCNDVTKEVCRTVDKVNEAYTKLNNDIGKTERDIIDLETKIANETTKAAEATVKYKAALQQKATLEAQRTALMAAKSAAQLAFDAEQQVTNAQAEITKATRENAESIEKELEMLRKKLVDTESIKREIAKIIDEINVLSFFTINWLKGIDVAGEKYIESGLTLSKSMINGKSNFIGIYKTWTSCYGASFMAVPYQIPELGCNAQTEYQKLVLKIDDLTNKLLPPPLNQLKKEVDKIKSHIQDELKKELTKAGLELVKFATDKSTSELVALMASPENATEFKLNDVFSKVGDSGGKKLLIFNKVSDLINKDIALSNNQFSPTKFTAISYSLTLAKLSLLSATEVNKLIDDTAGWSLFSYAKYKDTKNFSVLFNAIKSIDGNHPWGAFGLPYAHQDKVYKLDPKDRQFGYSVKQGERYGFLLFQNERLRENVFLELFPKPFGGEVMQRAEYQAPLYPFPSCMDNPFPVAIDAKGIPKLEDLKCSD